MVLSSCCSRDNVPSANAHVVWTAGWARPSPPPRGAARRRQLRGSTRQVAGGRSWRRKPHVRSSASSNRRAVAWGARRADRRRRPWPEAIAPAGFAPRRQRMQPRRGQPSVSLARFRRRPGLLLPGPETAARARTRGRRRGPGVLLPMNGKAPARMSGPRQPVGGAGVRPCRRMTSATFAGSGGPPGVDASTSWISRK
jgi:hypothetical protein